VEEGYRPVSVLNLFLNNFIPINSYVIRMEALAKTPVFFDESLEVLEDWHFFLKLLENGFRFKAIPDTLSEFRLISDGNKQVKDHPDVWDAAGRYIHAYIHDSLFRMNGRMLQMLMKEDEEKKSTQNREAIRLREELNKRNIEVEALGKDLDAANNRIENLKQEIVVMKEVYNDITAACTKAANEVLALRGSKSWKITAPLRRIYGLILKIFSAVKII